MEREIKDPHKPPHHANVLVYALRKNRSLARLGSGVLIGRGHVLTAAHVVHPKHRFYRPGGETFGGYRIYCIPGYQSGRKKQHFQTRRVLGIDYPETYREAAVDLSKDRPFGDDLALLTLDAPVESEIKIPRWVGIGDAMLKIYARAQENVNVTGYPAVKKGKLWHFIKMPNFAGKVFFFQLGYDVSALSGGPVWIKDPDGGLAVIGLVVTYHDKMGFVGILPLGGTEQQWINGWLKKQKK